MPVTWKFLLKLVFSIGILVYLGYSCDLPGMIRQLSQTDLSYVPLGMGVYLFSQWVSSVRWHWFCKAQGISISLWNLFAFYMMGMFFSLFLPGSVSGDVGRTMYLAQKTACRKREAFLSILAERGMGFLALILLTAAACLLPEARPIALAVKAVAWSMAGASLLFCVGLYAIFKSHFYRNELPLKTTWIPDAFWEWLMLAKPYFNNVPLLSGTFLQSLFLQGLMILIHVLVRNALGLESIPVAYLTAVYGTASLLSLLPVSLNGLGVREGTYVVLLGHIGIPQEAALLFSLYWFAISLFTSLLGSLFFIKYPFPNRLNASPLEPLSSPIL
jgi:glycosyltransferase 2 family protein